MIIFRRRQKERLKECRDTLTSQIEQLKEELDSKERPDYKQSLQHVVNALVSAHLTSDADISHHPRTDGTEYSRQT